VRYVKISIAVLVLVAMIVFAVQNIETVKVSFIVWSVDAPQVFVILGTYVLGMLTGWGLVEVLKRTLREKS
jgi:putative membrane protein